MGTKDTPTTLSSQTTSSVYVSLSYTIERFCNFFKCSELQTQYFSFLYKMILIWFHIVNPSILCLRADPAQCNEQAYLYPKYRCFAKISWTCFDRNAGVAHSKDFSNKARYVGKIVVKRICCRTWTRLTQSSGRRESSINHRITAWNISLILVYRPTVFPMFIISSHVSDALGTQVTSWNDSKRDCKKRKLRFIFVIFF
jgi:hypothetical protein